MSGTPNLTQNNGTGPNEQQLGSWENGWYVFENGQVLGPFNAKEAFSSQVSASTGEARMVSRKGFTQWYPVRDFAEIYSMIGHYSDHLNQVSFSSNHPLTELEPKARQIGPQATPVNNMPRGSNDFPQLNASTREDQGSQNPSENVVINNESNYSTSQFVPQPSLTKAQVKQLRKAERQQQKFAERQMQAARSAAKSQNLLDPVIFAQAYLQLQSRLRLGRVTSPTLGALVYTPLTLGGYWWDWFARVSEEVNWHVNGTTRLNSMLPTWMCMIPGVHLILAYVLARNVMQMEVQNGYRTISPVVVTMAALFPPFYILLIQSALNRHWRLHVYNGTAPK